jgi:hypothetical protein
MMPQITGHYQVHTPQNRYAKPVVFTWATGSHMAFLFWRFPVDKVQPISRQTVRMRLWARSRLICTEAGISLSNLIFRVICHWTNFPYLNVPQTWSIDTIKATQYFPSILTLTPPPPHKLLQYHWHSSFYSCNFRGGGCWELRSVMWPLSKLHLIGK